MRDDERASLIDSVDGSRTGFAGRLRALLVVVAVLGVALASGGTGGTATSSPSDTTPYPSYCAADQPTCLFRMGVAYCRYRNDIDGNFRDDTEVACWNLGHSQRFKDFTGRWVILHRGWAWMSTQDSNKVLLHAHATFRLPALALISDLLVVCILLLWE